MDLSKKRGVKAVKSSCFALLTFSVKTHDFFRAKTALVEPLQLQNPSVPAK